MFLFNNKTKESLCQMQSRTLSKLAEGVSSEVGILGPCCGPWVQSQGRKLNDIFFVIEPTMI